MQNIKHYRLIKSLGKGGMGEVFLAYDTECKRQVALKKIKEDIRQGKMIKERFLKEAEIAGQLSHPSILPIYTIHREEEAFYTMPYIEGETLKQIFKDAREREKAGGPPHPIGMSIPALLRIFLNVCQAVAYTHNKKILHRDLKPENIMIGKYGEVLIFDWGLADYIGQKEMDDEILSEANEKDPELTQPGKVVGTLAYLAPERALGKPSTPSTEIYALGIILYQILTLKLPFYRKNLKTFRKTMQKEKLLDPLEVAPYRDISPKLSEIVKKALAFSPEDRYKNVEELISDLENYLKGIPDWVFSNTLSVKEKSDWEFQENILLSKHIAISRQLDALQWVSLMISQATFSGNIKIEAEFSVGKHGQGIGLLLNIPEQSERKRLEEGYCLWIDKEQASRLFRDNIEVMQVKTLELLPGETYKIAIEKVEDHLRFYLNGILQCHYISHTPLRGAHIGILAKDDDFSLKPIKVFTSSQNLTVSCLAIPDAFLASNDYQNALNEYRCIASSFPGRSEASEAIFRAGVTLIEEAMSVKKKNQKKQGLLFALEEFGKLRNTPGAPLEFLGKSLVYKAENDIEEELKCLELAVRKYNKHSLLSKLREQIVFRLHESASQDRIAAYHFALLAIRQLPEIFTMKDNQNLLDSLKKDCPPLAFIEFPASEEPAIQNAFLAIQLAFWLVKPITLVEMIESYPSHQSIHMTALFALLKLGYLKWAEEAERGLPQSLSPLLSLVHFAEKDLPFALANLSQEKELPFWHKQIAFYLFEKAIIEGKTKEVLPFFQEISRKSFSKAEKNELTYLQLESLLWQGKWKDAEHLFSSIGWKEVEEEDSMYYNLFLSYLVKEKGKNEVKKQITGSRPLWLGLLQKPELFKNYLKRSLFGESVQTMRKMALFAFCSGDKATAKKLQKMLQKINKPRS